MFFYTFKDWECDFYQTELKADKYNNIFSNKILTYQNNTKYKHLKVQNIYINVMILKEHIKNHAYPQSGNYVQFTRLLKAFKRPTILQIRLIPTIDLTLTVKIIEEQQNLTSLKIQYEKIKNLHNKLYKEQNESKLNDLKQIVNILNNMQLE